ncbi:MAG: alpha/beta hydrolase, partial [Alphaproteobacteria bacterium]
YTLSPEAQYPQTTNDLFAVLQYVAEYGAKYNLDTGRLAVAGDSVGGNMAAVMALMAKANDNKPEIDFQLLLYPVTDAAFETKSYNAFAEGPWLTKKAMEWFWKQYAPDENSRGEIYASPLRAASEELEGLPAALIITDENDVLRDEGEAYARKLDEAGVTVGSVRINGTIHDFLMLNALADSVPTKAALALAVVSLQDVFDSLVEDETSEA